MKNRRSLDYAFVSYVAIVFAVLTLILWVNPLQGQEPDAEENIDTGTNSTRLFKRLRAIKRLKTVRVVTKKFSEKRAISAEVAASLPGTGNDALAGISAFPGVAPQSDFSPALLVRGGSGKDTSYRFNDVTIGAPFHDAFLYSVFPPEILKQLLFYPGGFSAKYENVQGAVIDVESKDFYDYYTPFAVTFLLTPVGMSFSYTQQISDRFRVTIGGRGSFVYGYINVVENLFNRDIRLLTDAYDAHFLFDWKINDAHYFNVFVLFSSDRYQVNIGGRRFVEYNNDFSEILAAEKVDSSYYFLRIWDSEALQYHLDLGKFSYRMSLSRYSEVYREKNYQVDSYVARNEEYAWRHEVSYTFNESFTLENYLKYSLDRALGTRKVHPGGLASPSISAYATKTNEFATALATYNDGLTDVEEDVSRSRFSLASSLVMTLPEFKVNVGGVFYVSSLSEEVVNGDFRLEGRYSPALKNGVIEVFGYAGRFLQYPELAVPDTNVVLAERLDDQLFFQNYSLRTPYTYQFGLGGLWDPGPVELSLEGYTKLLYQQVVTNPTYNRLLAQAKTNGNFPTVSDAGGLINGFEFQVRSKMPLWLIALGSYTFSLATVEQRQVITQDSDGKQETDPKLLYEANRMATGLDDSLYYTNLPKKRVSSEDNSEHVLKMIVAFALGRHLRLGFRLTMSSGLPYTPRVVGYDRSLAGAFGEAEIDECNSMAELSGAPECNFRVFVADPLQLQEGRYPWTVSFDLRLDWTYFKNEFFEGTIYFDLLSIHTLVYKNVTSYEYNDRATGALGTAPKADERREFSNELLLPIMGLEFKF